MKYTILVFLLTSATTLVAAAPVGGQHNAVYQEAHYRVPSSGGLYPSPAHSFVSELGDHENRNKWMGTPYTKFTGGFQHSAQTGQWVKDVGVQDTQSHRQYWNPLHTNDGDVATWPKEKLPEGDTYVHLYHLSGQGIGVPPNSAVVQDEWPPHSERYHLHASLPQVYDADSGHYAGGWIHGAEQPAYVWHSSDSNDGYWADQVNSGLVPSNNEPFGSMYTELLPGVDTWSAHGIDPDLVDWVPVEDVHAFLSGQEHVNPTQEAFSFYTDSEGGNSEAGVDQQTSWGDGILGESIGIGEWGSSLTGTDLGGDTKTKGSTETNTGNFNVGSLGDGVSTTFIDSGNLTGDKGTGIEILGASKVVAGTTGAEFSNGSSDTRTEALGDGVREVTGSSAMHNNAGDEKFIGNTGTLGGTADIKEDASASGMLGGGLGQYDSTGSVTESGGAQSGTAARRPTWGEWSAGSAKESGTGLPSVGESATGNAVKEDNDAEHSASGISTTGTSGPKGTEFESSSATVESTIPQASKLSSKDKKNASVAAGGVGDSSLGSSVAQEATSGPFDGYVKEAGTHVTSHGDGNVGAAVDSSGSHVGHDKGSQIGIGESSEASSSSGGSSAGNGGKSRSGTGAGCTGNRVGDRQCKNTAAGATEAGAAGEKVTDIGIHSGSGHATKVNNANGRGKVGANTGNSGSILESGSGSSSAASETDTSNTNFAELVQPLLINFPHSAVAVAEAFAGIGPDGKVQASSKAKVFDSKSKTYV